MVILNRGCSSGKINPAKSTMEKAKKYLFTFFLHTEVWLLYMRFFLLVNNFIQIDTKCQSFFVNEITNNSLI